MSLFDTIPASGKAKKGIMDVAGMGMGSTIHHIAIQHVIPAVAALSYEMLEDKTKYSIHPNAGPMSRVHDRSCFILVLPIKKFCA